MPRQDFQLESTSNALSLHCRNWTPPEGATVKAHILFVHGFSEFVDTYNAFFDPVSDEGFVVTSYDQRGHGETAVSPADFGVSNEAHIRADLETVVTHVLKEAKGPLVLWGFSMGGAIVLNYMVHGKHRDDFQLFISGGPYIETAPGLKTGINGILLRLLPFVSRVYPSYVSPVRLTPELATDDPERWPLYRTQKLRHSRASAEFMNDAVIRGKRLLDPEFIKDIIDKPLLLAQGTNDQICDPEGAKEFFKIVKLSDKTLDLEEGLPHEMMNSKAPGPTNHWHTVRAWLNERLNAPVPAVSSK